MIQFTSQALDISSYIQAIKMIVTRDNEFSLSLEDKIIIHFFSVLDLFM